jgi:O-antigen ligase
LSALPLLGYSVISLSLNFRIEGFQNALVWATFSLALFALPFWISAKDQKAIASALRIVVLVVPATKIITFTGGFDFYGEGSYALVAVVLLAYAVSQKPPRWFDYAAPWLLLFSILLCNVRMAAFIAGLLILFTAHHLHFRPLVKTLISVGAGIAAGILIWIFVGDRFLNRGDEGLAQFVGEDSPLAGIGTTNRAAAWAFILENLPPGTNWWGQGPGHSSYLADELLGIDHPHNEYLRIFFDFGWAGLVLFLGGSLALFVALIINWRRTQNPLALASVLLVPAVALMAATDNPIIFVYVIFPVAVIIAAAFASKARKTEITSTET